MYRPPAATPDVLAVFTGADLMADGIHGLPSRARRQRPDGKPNFEPAFHALAHERVHVVGDPVVAVVAETLAAAKEAAERVVVDYEPLPAVTDTAAAVERGAPAVWDEVPDNVCFYQEVGDKAAVEAAFARAKHVMRERFVISRVAVSSMEARTALGVYDEREERYTLTAGVADAACPAGRARRERLQAADHALPRDLARRGRRASASRAASIRNTCWCCGRRASSVAR